MRKYFLPILLGVSLILFSIASFTLSDFYNSPPKIVKNAQKNLTCDKSEIFPGKSVEISKIKKGKTDYFPKEIFTIEALETWYGSNLKEMKEESFLKISDKNKEAYRFLWLRSFHHPIFVRIERNQDKYNLVAKEYDGKADIKPGKLLRTDEKSISKEEWCEFIELLEKSDFWNIKAREYSDIINGFDGAQWILEAAKEDRYHAIDAWSPEDENFREVCMFLLKLSGRNIDEIEVY